MSRTLLVLATLFLTILQVCQANLVRLAFGPNYLTTDGHHPGAQVRFGDQNDAALWQVVKEDGLFRIIDPISGLSLGYDRIQPNAYVFLDHKPTFWGLLPTESDHYEIFVENGDLVLGQLLGRSYPSRVGLTSPNKDFQVWRVEFVQDEAECYGPPEDDHELILNNLFLSAVDERPGSPVRFLPHPEPGSVWVILPVEDNDFVIFSHRSNLYLSYDQENPFAPVTVEKEPRLWNFDLNSDEGVQILTAERVDGGQLALAFHGARIWPPFAGLQTPRKDPSQLWKLRPSYPSESQKKFRIQE